MDASLAMHKHIEAPCQCSNDSLRHLLERLVSLGPLIGNGASQLEEVAVSNTPREVVSNLVQAW